MQITEEFSFKTKSFAAECCSIHYVCVDMDFLVFSFFLSSIHKFWGHLITVEHNTDILLYIFIYMFIFIHIYLLVLMVTVIF